jgi:hypothetical protein
VSRLEDVSTALWEDEDFDDLSAEAKLIYLWSFTNDRCGMSGVYRVKLKSIGEGCLAPKKRDEVLAELADAGYLHYVDGWIWVRTRVKHLRTKGEKMARSVVRDIQRVPEDHPLRAAFLTHYVEKAWVSKWLVEAENEGLSIPHSTPIDGLQGKGQGLGKGSVVAVEESKTPKDAPARTTPKPKVGSKVVTDAEYALATGTVAAFNEIFGTKLTTDPHLTPIVMRVREHPRMNAGHHRRVIGAVFAGDHWWKGTPGPKIIYGNAAQFEQSVELARAGSAKQAQRVNVTAEADRIAAAQGLA